MEKTEISMNEYRVLNYIKDKKDVPEDSIDIGLDERIRSSAISYLEFKDLISVKKEQYDKFAVTTEGKKYLEQGFPEERLYRLLIQKKKCTIAEIKDILGDDYRIGMANIAKMGIKPVNGVMEFMDGNFLDIFKTMKEALSAVENGGKISDEMIEVFMHRGLVNRHRNMKRIINISIKGIKSLENYENEDFLELLTPEIISKNILYFCYGTFLFLN